MAREPELTEAPLRQPRALPLVLLVLLAAAADDDNDDETDARALRALSVLYAGMDGVLRAYGTMQFKLSFCDICGLLIWCTCSLPVAVDYEHKVRGDIHASALAVLVGIVRGAMPTAKVVVFSHSLATLVRLYSIQPL